MLSELAVVLEQLPIAATLRRSVWLYPLVNTAHIVGIALLFGAIVPFDLRLLGLWRGSSVPALERILVPVAAGGLAIAIPAGVLLFVTRAADYVGSPFFLAKIGVVALALANALAAFALRRRALAGKAGTVRGLLRIGAVLSVLLWLAAITLGRLIGYF